MATEHEAAPAARRGFEGSRRRLEAAKATTPGGVHSNIRLADQPGPLFFESGDGSHLHDVDGNDLIDYVLANGPMILGHRPPEVIEAVRAQLDRGLLYAAQTDLEVEVASRVIELVPCAERVRFNLTGTEAVQAALRLARAATGRQKVLIFQGHYDGWADNVLFNVGTRGGPTGAGNCLEPVAESAGIERGVERELIVADWNDAAALEAVFASNGDELAAVLMEPIMGNTAVVVPRAGYLERARQLCSEHGTVLIFDEIITGFRVGLHGAQGRLGVTPDLAAFGKAVASGFPVACVAGRTDLFDPVATGRVMHAGTFNAYPVGMAAARATLAVLSDPARRVYEGMTDLGTMLLDGIRAAARDAGVNLHAQGLPMLMSTAFTDVPEIRDHRDTTGNDAARLRALVRGLIERGVRIAPRGNLMLSAAHTDADVTATVAAFREVLGEMASTPAASPA